MQVLDTLHQLNIVNAGEVIVLFDVPCEGQASQVTGELVVVAKDYQNQPTVDKFRVDFANTMYYLLPDGQINYAATLAGVALAPVVALKETDKGIFVFDRITAPKGIMRVTINFSVVPDPFNLYIRPILKITNIPDAGSITKPAAGDGRQELPYGNEVDDLLDTTALDSKKKVASFQGVAQQPDVRVVIVPVK